MKRLKALPVTIEVRRRDPLKSDINAALFNFSPDPRWEKLRESGRGYDITNSPPALLSRPLIPNGFYGSRVVNEIPGLLFHINTDTFSKIKKI